MLLDIQRSLHKSNAASASRTDRHLINSRLWSPGEPQRAVDHAKVAGLERKAGSARAARCKPSAVAAGEGNPELKVGRQRKATQPSLSAVAAEERKHNRE
jgi:hypothetical protein